MAAVPGNVVSYDQGPSTVAAMTNPILLYDGVCGLCNRFVRFILRLDHHDLFRFASLQSPVASRILERHGISAATLDTLYIVVDPKQPSERVLSRSDAVAYVLYELGGESRLLSRLWKLLPLMIRDAAYNLVARNRYGVFGRFDACPLPEARDRHKFLDV